MTNALPHLLARSADSHKGDYGRALLIGGSRGMSGAIALAGIATLRSGAGLVTLATADACLDTVASFEPSLMTVSLPCDADGRISLRARDRIEQLANNMTCLACGPGLGRSEELNELVRWIYHRFPQPMVFDADGLNALAAHPQGLDDPGGPRIVTPHPGEFRRLMQRADVGQLADQAMSLAGRHGIIVVLKGHHTLVTDGDRQQRNDTGNPGMATGGTGDVLTGVITALVCQGLAPFDAARLGVHVHGLAGDLAVDELGEVSLIASDLLDGLPPAFQQVASSDLD